MAYQAAALPWTWQLRLLLVSGLLVAVAVVALVGHLGIQRKAAQAEQDGLLAFRGLHPQVLQSLAKAYVDGDKNLLADAPAESARWIAPQPIVLAHYLGDDEGMPRVDWEGLCDQLIRATGREVRLQPYLHTPEEMEGVAAGRVQLVAVHAAEVPKLVNSAGIIPFAALATDQGLDGNRLVIAAKRGSGAESLESLRGQMLVCTEPDSVTGFRAAIVAIYLQTGMQPKLDYDVYFSHKHELSIRGVAMGKFPFIALSNDVLDRLLEQGSVEQEQYRVLYESPPIPRLTLAHIHTLAPELAERVKTAVLEFNNQTLIPYHFEPIDYRRDYEFARRLDDAFEPRFGQIFILDPN